jgi:hypothetical protein
MHYHRRAEPSHVSGSTTTCGVSIWCLTLLGLAGPPPPILPSSPSPTCFMFVQVEEEEFQLFNTGTMTSCCCNDIGGMVGWCDLTENLQWFASFSQLCLDEGQVFWTNWWRMISGWLYATTMWSDWMEHFMFVGRGKRTHTNRDVVEDSMMRGVVHYIQTKVPAPRGVECVCTISYFCVGELYYPGCRMHDTSLATLSPVVHSNIQSTNRMNFFAFEYKWA